VAAGGDFFSSMSESFSSSSFSSANTSFGGSTSEPEAKGTRSESCWSGSEWEETSGGGGEVIRPQISVSETSLWEVAGLILSSRQSPPVLEKSSQAALVHSL
jgi:hypothetical protein